MIWLLVFLFLALFVGGAVVVKWALDRDFPTRDSEKGDDR